MGFYASSCLADEDAHPKNRVVGSERFSFNHARLPASQPPESHQETTLALTIIVSGRHSFWTMDSFSGFNTDPVSLHKYVYVGADPVAGLDPTGEMTITDLMTAWGIIGLLGQFLATPSLAESVPTGTLTLEVSRDTVTKDISIINTYRQRFEDILKLNGIGGVSIEMYLTASSFEAPKGGVWVDYGEDAKYLDAVQHGTHMFPRSFNVTLTTLPISIDIKGIKYDAAGFSNRGGDFMLLDISHASPETLAHELGHCLGHPGISRDDQRENLMYEWNVSGRSHLDPVFKSLLKRFLN